MILRKIFDRKLKIDENLIQNEGALSIQKCHFINTTIKAGTYVNRLSSERDVQGDISMQSEGKVDLEKMV